MKKLFLLVSVCCMPLLAQSVARSAFDSALRMENEGNVEQALTQYLRLIEGKQDEHVSLMASLQAGKIYLRARDYERATKLFEKVVTYFQYPELAAEAVLNIGKIRYQTARNLDDVKFALGEFQHAILTYKGTRAVQEALMYAGTIQENLNNYDQAKFLYQTVLFEHLESELAPAAHFRLARTLVLAGQYDRALEEFQKIRMNYPGHSLAELSRLAASAVYRLYFRPDPTSLFRSAEKAAVTSKDPVQMELLDHDKMVVLNKDQQLVTFDSEGKILNAQSVAGEQIFLRGGAIYQVGKKAIVLPSQQSATPVYQDEDKFKTFGEIFSFIENSFGEMFVAVDRGGIWRLELAQNRYLAQQLVAGSVKFRRLRVDSRNSIYALEEDRKTISVFDREGKSLAQISISGRSDQRMEDFYIDMFDNIYVLGDKEEVFIFQNLYTADRKKLLARVPVPLRDARSLVVDYSGRLYVCGKKGLIRFS